MASSIGIFTKIEQKLVEQFWPGPLTLVMNPQTEHLVHPTVTAGS